MTELYVEIENIITKNNRSTACYKVSRPAGFAPNNNNIMIHPVPFRNQQNLLFSIDLEASSSGKINIHIPEHLDIIGAVLWQVNVTFNQTQNLKIQFSGEDRYFHLNTAQQIIDGTLINVDIINNLNQHFLAFGIMGHSDRQKIKFLLEEDELAIILPPELVDKHKPEQLNHLSFSTLNHHIEFQIPKFIDEARFNLNDIYPALTKSIDYFNAMIYTDPGNINFQDDKGLPILPSGNIKMRHGQLLDIKNDNL